jgi:hypothetical protein
MQRAPQLSWAFEPYELRLDVIFEAARNIDRLKT